MEYMLCVIASAFIVSCADGAAPARRASEVRQQNSSFVPPVRRETVRREDRFATSVATSSHQLVQTSAKDFNGRGDYSIQQSAAMSLSMSLMSKQYAAHFSSRRENCDAIKKCDERWVIEKTCVARVEHGMPPVKHFLMKVSPRDFYISGSALCEHTSWE